MKIGSIIRLSMTTISLIYLLIPILITIPASFTNANYPSFPPKGWSVQWYTKLFERPEFMEAFFNSVKFAFLASFIAVLVGTLGAIAINKYDIPGKSLLVSFVTSPLTVPQLVLGIALMIFFTRLMLAGTSTGFLIAHIVICVPYVIRFVLTGLSGFDYTLERAAMILGASPTKVFWKITLPLIRPAILAGALFSFLISFDNVTVSLFMISSDMRTLPLEIFSNMQDTYSPLVASVSCLVILISAVFILILEKIHGVGRMFGGTH
jgi:putative spermidine/putrescine transport system permease protein